MALPNTVSPQGATVTFPTSGWAALLLGIGLDGWERTARDVTNLATTGKRQKKPGTLVEPGTMVLRVQMNPDDMPPIDQAAERIVLEWPAPAGYETGAKLAGTGFVTGFSFDGNGGDEEDVTGEVTVTWDGDDGPEFSDASATAA